MAARVENEGIDMAVLVLGAGVIGLTTAYYLQQAGHRVTVVDRHPHVATETSYANGAQLSYSYVAPLAGPGVLSKLPKWFIDADAPMRFRPTLDPDLWRWCRRFVSACTRTQSLRATREMLALSFLSRDLMREMIAAEPSLAFDYTRSGKLVLHRSPEALSAAVDLLAFQRTLGCEQEALDADACVAREPALAHVRNEIAGGIYTRSEDTADCHLFCVGIERLLRSRGVEFALGTSISALQTAADGTVSATTADGDRLQAEHIVVAMGSDSVPLLKSIGIHVLMYPLKGYSLTVTTRERNPATHLETRHGADVVTSVHGVMNGANDAAPATAPSISITDFARKVVYARLGNRLRIAGMADLGRPNRDLEKNRLATLRREAEALFPDAGDYEHATPWAGLRPATPTGLPIIGRTRIPNLWVNIGQGALGFTLATGSAKLLADGLSGIPSSIDCSAYSLLAHCSLADNALRAG
ncbi:MAG: D-amino acid dehydrogenase [Janthinobacterium lividum]